MAGDLVILPDDQLYRRVAPETVDFAPCRVRRNAYYSAGTPDPEISVHVRRVVGSVEDALQRANRPSFGMGVLRVADVWELGLDVRPQDRPGDEGHAVIVGAASKALCDQLAERTEIVKMPMTPS